MTIFSHTILTARHCRQSPPKGSENTEPAAANPNLLILLLLQSFAAIIASLHPAPVTLEYVQWQNSWACTALMPPDHCRPLLLVCAAGLRLWLGRAACASLVVRGLRWGFVCWGSGRRRRSGLWGCGRWLRYRVWLCALGLRSGVWDIGRGLPPRTMLLSGL